MIAINVLFIISSITSWNDTLNFGSLATIPLALTFVIIPKNSLITLILGLSFERAIF